MKIWLIVVFLVNGEPTLIDGWWPREAPNMETCLARAEKVRDYLSTDDNPHVPEPEYEVHCFEGGYPS